MTSKQPRQNKLTPGHRLRESWEFRRFFGRSSLFRLSECLIYRIPNELGHFRLGITLKARGSSLERNKTKRQIREAFRCRAALLGAYDYNVVIPATKKLVHPFSIKLKECFNRELENVLSAR